MPQFTIQHLTRRDTYKYLFNSTLFGRTRNARGASRPNLSFKPPYDKTFVLDLIDTAVTIMTRLLATLATFIRVLSAAVVLSCLVLSSPVLAGKTLGYYMSWASDPSTINWTNLDIVFFAFAIPSGNSVVLNDPPYDGPRLQALFQGARQRGKKVVLSVGGWNNGGFSEQVQSQNSAAFIQSIKSIINQYGLDGIDIDWEYPNSPGVGHTYSPQDTANLQAFLPLLRTALGSKKIISMAVPQKPWLDANSQPSTNLTQAARALSFVFIMNYDVAWHVVGSNAPYANKCGMDYIGAVESIQLWRNAGFTSSKIALGVPFYGYNHATTLSKISRKASSSRSGTLAHSHSHVRSRSSEPAQQEKRATAYTDMQPINFNQLIADGSLVLNQTSGKWVGGGGYRRSWDSCSSTPFLTKSGSLVSYDDPHSIQLKGKLAATKKLYGAGTWAIQMDYQGQLMAALRAGLNSA
ncbi:unnamed protein product [Tilletia controversa]|nr:unnamed protein product [Tilletia caries]CAD6895973.1 unnamed protein product [Tilletia controversa]CAD6929529.1 unnamed protein product [Tilletia caries]CAD6945294.1 unnamed protein product [Tilletia controversa]CAD6966857.1 unnamed protein product [Tilletia controversa]